jgi:hypothetical protein
MFDANTARGQIASVSLWNGAFLPVITAERAKSRVANPQIAEISDNSPARVRWSGISTSPTRKT